MGKKIKMTPDQKDALIDFLLEIKGLISEANDYAETINAYPNDPTQILDLSCRADELMAELDED